MKTAIINAKIIQPDYIIPEATLVIEDGIIVDFGKKIDTTGMEIIDAKGAYVGPGLVDIHTHADGYDFFTDEPVKVAKKLMSHGITTVMPALYFSSTRDELIAQAKKIKEAQLSGEADNIFGLYMEAPYMVCLAKGTKLIATRIVLYSVFTPWITLL